MNFDDKNVPSLVSNISNDKLLLIDWNIHSFAENNYVFQDFGKYFFESLKGAVKLFRKYKEINFLYPSFTNHPNETVTFFEKYFTDFKDLGTKAAEFVKEDKKLQQYVATKLIVRESL